FSPSTNTQRFRQTDNFCSLDQRVFGQEKMISQTILMRRVGIISVPTLLLAITIAWFENLDGIFNPPFFIAALNVSLVTAVSVIVAYLSAKSYLESGLSAVVLLGTGVLTYGVGLFLRESRLPPICLSGSQLRWSRVYLSE